MAAARSGFRPAIGFGAGSSGSRGDSFPGIKEGWLGSQAAPRPGLGPFTVLDSGRGRGSWPWRGGGGAALRGVGSRGPWLSGSRLVVRPHDFLLCFFFLDSTTYVSLSDLN
jgi:hypothetical protein